MEKILNFFKSRKEPFWLTLGGLLFLFAASCVFKSIYSILFIIGAFLFIYAALIIYRVNDLLDLLKKSSVGASVPKEKKKVKKLVEIEVEEDDD